jgi:MoaD family protein
MADVKVKYLGLFKTIAGTGSEEIKANSLGELIDEVVRRHEGIEQQLYEKVGSDASLILTYNGQTVKNVKDYQMKLKDGDEVVLMSIISGG